MSWLDYPSVNNYGKVIDGFSPKTGPNVYLKPDINYDMPKGIEITSIANGKVSDVVNNPSWAQGSISVTVEMQPAYNDIATHCAYNFLGEADVKIGDDVPYGTLVGKSGDYGFIAFALTNDSTYGTTTFYKYNGDPRLDPTQFVEQARNGQSQQQTPTSNLFSGFNSNVAIGIGIIALVLVGLVLFVGLSGV